MIGPTPEPAEAAETRSRAQDPARAPPRPPLRVPDHELLCRIGSGGYGVVWLARNVLGSYRAVKVVYRKEFENDRPFEREFAGIQRFEPISRSHPSQVNILHVGRTSQYFYYLMELADDQGTGQQIHPEGYTPRTLRGEIQRRGKLPLEECVAIGLTLTRALEHLHSHGLVHRDVKPSNIIFVNGTPKLADLGLVTGSDATRSHVGTEGYIPPEGAGTPQADLYSLGKVLYEMSTGKDRQDFPEPPTLHEGGPEERAFIEFQEVLLKACETDPRRRYQSATELRAELELLRVGKSVRRLRTLERRQALLMPLGLAAGVLLLVGSGAYLFTRHEAREALRQARRADEEAGRAKQAEREARELLWASYLAQAQAQRRTGLAGRRFESLATLRKAAQIHPSVEVRNEAIACLALPDLGTVQWREAPPGTQLWAVDRRFERYARADDKGNISVRRLSDDRLLGRFPGAGVPANSSLAFSPDGRSLAVFYGTEVLDLCVWDLDRQAVRLKTAGINGRCFDFSPDNRLLVLAQHQGPLQVYDIASGRCTRSLAQGPLPYFVRFSPGGRRLAVSSTEDPTVQIRDFETGRVLQSLVHSNVVRGIAWNSSGTVLATACEDRNIYVWDAMGGVLRGVLRGHQGPVVTVGFNHRGDTLASSAWDGTMRLWEPSSLRLLVTKSAISDSVFSLDDRWLTHRSVGSRKLGICEVAYGLECRSLRPDLKLAERITSCEFSPDSRRLLSAASDGARISDAETGEQLAFLPERSVVCARFLPAGGLLTCGEGGLKKWPVDVPANGRRYRFGVPFLLGGQPVPLETLSMTEDGRRLVVNAGGIVFVLDAGKGGLQRQFGTGDPFFFRSAISPDGRWVAGVPMPQSLVRIWNLQTGKVAVDLPCLGVNQVAFSPDSRRLVVGSNEAYECWTTRSWRCVYRTSRSESGGIHGRVAFSPDGRLTALTYSAQAVRLLDTETGQERATFEMPEPDVILCLAFSPDGHQLAVSGETPVIYVWNLELIRRELAAMKLDWE